MKSRRSKRFVVIIAGGAGTRFWPRSRRRYPKQLLPIVNGRSMLQSTVDRVRGMVPADRILILTTQLLRRMVRRQLPELPAGNIIGEPVGRNTAPCIGLAAIHVERRDRDGVMIVLPADHVVTGKGTFRGALALAAELAEQDHLVTIGVPPTRPETGYGYIKCGGTVPRTNQRAAWVDSFKEKPGHRQAERFLRNPGYLWNSGMFAWRARRILDEIDIHLPKLGRRLDSIRSALGTARAGAVLARVYPKLPAISVDHAILERARGVTVVRGRFGWNDVGSWAALEDLWRAKRRDPNAVRGHGIAVNARGCIVYAPDRVVALCGVDDLIVVDTPDAVLVCRKQRAQDVRSIVREIERVGPRGLL